MKILLNWLKDYIDLKNIPEKELVERLTLSTCEVEGVRKLDEHITNTVVGEIAEIQQHPNADKLKVCVVHIGENSKLQIPNTKSPRSGIPHTFGDINQGAGQIQNFNDQNLKNYPLPTTHYPLVQVVCGGTNLRVGVKVVVALPGARVLWHGQEGWVEMKETEIRGVKSVGMICAAEELEIPWRHEPSEGEHPIMILPEDALVGESIVSYLGLNDTALDIDNKSITHRADLFSHIGIASELGAIFDLPFKDVRYVSPLESIPDWESLKQNKDIAVKIEAKDGVKRSSFLLLRGLRVKPSPLWLQNRLRAFGLRPINNVVDATNYVMWEVGTPLHAFDALKIGDSKMIVRFAKDGEKVITLDGAERMLGSTMMVGEDGAGRIIDLPGIMGGQLSEVDSNTMSVLLQSAAFDRVVIRKSTLKLAHRTDGAAFHERAADPNLTVGALVRTLELLKETCPDAEVCQVIDWYPKHIESRTIEFDPATIQKQLGVEISEQESRAILERLGFSISSLRGSAKQSRSDAQNEIATSSISRNDNPVWSITIPPRRKDIQGFQDMCEEVGRIFGYDHIKPQEHAAPLRAPETPKLIQTRELFRDSLVSSGYDETMNYIFWSDQDVKWLGVRPELLIEVQNPVSEDLKYLRSSLLPGLLKTVALNQGRFESCKLFEVGKVFGRVFDGRGAINRAPTERFTEHERFGCVIADSEGVEQVFRKMVGMWEEVIRDLSLPQDVIRGALDRAEQLETTRWLSAQESVSLMIGERVVGVLGVVKQKILDLYGVKRSVVFMELDAERLTEMRENRWEYQKIPSFPSVLRDVALVADKQVTYGQISAILKAIENLVNIELFDVYQGKELGDGKRSLAFHLEFSHPERTLKAEEVDESLNEILSKLKTQLNVALRK